jgi:SAM-dependent methyltransferase
VPAVDYRLVANFYDSLVQFDEDVPFFVQEVAAVGGPVLELMAGTGRLSIPLVEAGARLTCVDSSPDMLGVLRRKLQDRGLTAEIVEADVRTMDLARRFDLAILPFNSFSELVSVSDQLQALRSVHQALHETGRFTCTLHNPVVRLRTIDGEWHSVEPAPLPSGEGGVGLRYRLDFDPETRTVTGTQVFETFGCKGEQTAEHPQHVRFSLPSYSEFLERAHSSGFSVITIYGNYDRAPYREEDSPYIIAELAPRAGGPRKGASA